MTREEALAIVRQIESLAATSPRDDRGAQEDIRQLVDQLRDAPGARDAVREKVSSIAAWTDILFSDRKRETYGAKRSRRSDSSSPNMSHDVATLPSRLRWCAAR